MIKITVEAPRSAGKSFFIKNYLLPAIDKATTENFALSIGGFTVVEKWRPNKNG